MSGEGRREMYKREGAEHIRKTRREMYKREGAEHIRKTREFFEIFGGETDYVALISLHARGRG